jgi:hypothetical protein
MLASLEDHKLSIRCVQFKVNKGPLGWGIKDVDADLDKNTDNRRI